jgi:hypothetical protein
MIKIKDLYLERREREERILQVLQIAPRRDLDPEVKIREEKDEFRCI